MNNSNESSSVGGVGVLFVTGSKSNGENSTQIISSGARTGESDPNHPNPITALGVDPGFANTGVGAVSLVDGQLVSRGVRVLQTTKGADKQFRAGQDDARRLRELFEGLTECFDLLRPDVLGVEAYTVFTPRGVDALAQAGKRAVDSVRAGLDPRRHIDDVARALSDGQSMRGVGLGQAAKTILVYGLAMSCAFARGVPVYVFTPADLKQRTTKRRSASKDAVGQALIERVNGLEAACETLPVSRREHAYDASGHAVLALNEYIEWARVTGTRVGG